MNRGGNVVRYAGEQIFEQANANINKNVWGTVVYNVRAYGAKGDGSSDDTAAIRKTIDSMSSPFGTLLIPDGTYIISSEIDILDKVTNLICYGTIKSVSDFTLGSKKACMYIKGSGIRGNLKIDCNNNGVNGLYLEGNNNEIHLDVSNIIGQPQTTNGLQSGFYLVGNENRLSVYGENISHGMAGVSESVPRLMTIENGSERNNITSAIGNNVALGIVINDKDNTIEYLDLDGGDSNGDWNGVYMLAPSDNIVIKNAVFRNWRQQMITAKNNGVLVGSVSAFNCSDSVLGLENASNIVVNEVQVHNSDDLSVYLLWLRPDNTLSKDVTFKNVTMRTYCRSDAAGAIIQAEAGALNNFSLSDFDIRVVYTAGKQKSLGKHTLGDRVDYRNGKITLEDTTGALTSSDAFPFTLPVSLDTTKISFWTDIMLICEGNQVLRIVNAIQEPVAVKGYRARVDIGPYLINEDQTLTYPVQVYSTSAPITGTWQRSSIVWNITPTASGNIGWVCITAGSPGTWKTFGVIGP